MPRHKKNIKKAAKGPGNEVGQNIQEVEKAFQVFVRLFRYILYPHKSTK